MRCLVLCLRTLLARISSHASHCARSLRTLRRRYCALSLGIFTVCFLFAPLTRSIFSLSLHGSEGRHDAQPSSEQLRMTEGTVLLHINFAIKQDQVPTRARNALSPPSLQMIRRLLLA